MNQPINTKAVTDRRELTFNCLACVREDLDKIEAAHNAGTLRTVGNWTPGQIFQHCATFMRFALDGFPPDMKPPALVKWLAQLIWKKKTAEGAQPPAGIQLKGALSALVPDDDVTFEEGLAEIRAVIARVQDNGERFSHDSPLFGTFTHEEWEHVQAAHCSLHFSFIKLDG